MRWAAALCLLMPIAAGCTGADEDASPGDRAALAGWQLDCTLGAHALSPWPQPCVARASYSPNTKAEMWLAVNPTNPANVVIGVKDMDTEYSADCVWNGVYVTHDGGAAWTEVHIGGRTIEREPTDPWYGYSCNTDPMFAFAEDGALHYGVEVYNFARKWEDDLGPLRPGWKILLATSRDGGLTWPDVITWQPDLVAVTDYSRMSISPATGTIFEAINNAGTGITCHVLAAAPGGMEVRPVVKVTPQQAPALTTCRDIDVAPDGTVVVAFVDGAQTYFVRSTDDGMTFLDSVPGFTYDAIPGQFENTEHRTGVNFETRYDLATATLWAIYGDDSAGSADIYVRSSDDDGATWTEPVRVHAESAAQQYIPNLAFGDDGSIHAFFYDRRYDPDDRLIDITHTISVDGGATWQEERVTAVSWDGDLGRHQYGYPFIGDYIGVDAVGGEVWAAFPDASLGGAPVAAAARVTSVS